jgi:hypothetical protein
MVNGWPGRFSASCTAKAAAPRRLWKRKRAVTSNFLIESVNPEWLNLFDRIA